MQLIFHLPNHSQPFQTLVFGYFLLFVALCSGRTVICMAQFWEHRPHPPSFCLSWFKLRWQQTITRHQSSSWYCVMGAIVQWQDRQYVGSLWGQNQGIPHVLSMSNPYPAQPHKISSFCLWGIYWSYVGITLRACWLQQAVSTQHVHSISDCFNVGKILKLSSLT